MKSKNYWRIPLFISISIFLMGYADENHSLINLNKITILPDNLTTRVILEPNSPLPTPRTYYSQENQSTIVLDLERVNTDEMPQVIHKESSIISGIRFKKNGNDNLHLFIDLKKRVPYRIFAEDKNTILEFNNMVRNAEGYEIDPQTKNALMNKAETTVILKKIDIAEENESISVIAKLSEEPVTKVFALDDPLRLVVDLYDTIFSNRAISREVGKFGIEKVRAAQFQLENPYTITRIVFDLKEPVLYSLCSSKNELIISFSKTQPYSQNEPSSKMGSSLLSNLPQHPASQELSKPEQKKQALDSPKKENHTAPLRAEIPENKNLTQEETQEEQFKPKTIAAPEEKYTGELISLKFKDADLRDVIFYLGEFAGLNVVFDPEVRGVVTVDLQDVPWDQALDVILKVNKMGRTIEGNILRIAPISVLTREEEELRRLQEIKELAGPTVIKTFTLSYSKAQDVQELLRDKLSQRGKVIVDGRTNTLIIEDVKDRVDLIERLIGVFDTPTPQVSIEARIVEATSNFVRNLGIQWGFRGIADPFYGNPTSLQFPHKILVDGAIIPEGIVTKGIGGPLGGYAVNLPAPAFSGAMGISFANVLDTFRLDMAISALETSGEGRIISTPSVTTQNNQEAQILQGRQIPVQTVANFTVTTRYVNAALELTATPQITAEGTIIMYIQVKNDAADFANLVQGIPPIITQSAKTTVMVPDGGTTVIGGIYRTEDSITRERIPFFHRIPILGNLFKSFARTKQNRELLIFITPRIIK